MRDLPSGLVALWISCFVGSEDFFWVGWGDLPCSVAFFSASFAGLSVEAMSLVWMMWREGRIQMGEVESRDEENVDSGFEHG